ncbi:unnamed protein product [Rotaria magnacalcarata]
MSFVSIEQARTNLQMQTQLKSFDAIRETVQQKWLNEISRFDVNAHWNHEAVVKFNSPIVHSLSSFTPEMPKGFDDQIHTKPDSMEHFYTDLSIWDAHRTQISFIVFHDSQRPKDIIRSIMLIVEQVVIYQNSHSPMDI